MFKGKMKALTFSYDDGQKQDIRFIELLNKYNLKGTFNINSDLFGFKRSKEWPNGVVTCNDRLNLSDIKNVYEGHEIASHTLTHPHLYGMEKAELIHEVEDDRIRLSEIAGYEVVGMAYPYGDCDDTIVKIISENTGIKYSRATKPTYNFDMQTDLIRFKPTIHHIEWEKLFELGEKFVNLKPESEQIFYVWGHSYEFDVDDSWDKMEEFMKLISGHDDIFYGTNKEILL